MTIFESEGIEIPDRITTLHQLAYYLLRAYMEEEHYRYTSKGKFDVLFENANAYDIGLYSACKTTAIEVLGRYSLNLNSRNSKQFVFIISKHLELILDKAKDN
jgi:hypothetical protein